MSKTTWLLVDCNGLAHRAYHAMGKDMSHGRMKTGMVFGFLRDLCGLMELHNTTNAVLAFDNGESKRVQLCPQYKQSRKATFAKLPAEERESKGEFYSQLNELRDKLLPATGFRNVSHFPGYEADDIIGSIVHQQTDLDIIIVSSDDDLFQLLSNRVIIWRPHTDKVETEKSFRSKWGISPASWPIVKAIAGGHNDIPGLEGVAEKTAAKYVSGNMNCHGTLFQRIREFECSEVCRRNWKLTQLPFEGCPSFVLKFDEVTQSSWLELCERFGLRTLRHAYPGLVRHKGLVE